MTGVAEAAIQTFVPQAAEIAREAGARLREYFIQGVKTEYKGDVDLVTVADRTVEKLIRRRLGEAFPEHGIFGEEGTRERLGSEYRWYVDPLDGTTNFAHGFPQFCVSMGLEHRPKSIKPEADGTLVAGVIYDPMRDELFAAERGRGTQLNGKAARVSRVATLAEALLATGRQILRPRSLLPDLRSSSGLCGRNAALPVRRVLGHAHGSVAGDMGPRLVRNRRCVS